MDTAPGSPPDLTNSLSSKKSSSYNSSSLSEDGPNELANFEDINLDDLPGAEQSDLFAKANGCTIRPDARRPGAMSHGLNSHPSLRLLTDVNKRSATAVKPPQDPPKPGRSTHVPPKLNPSSSNPLLPSLMPSGKRSRSTSPTPVFGTSPPQSLHSQPSPRRLSVRDNAPLRRSSWQPGRKTVKELEDEYHDSDEDLPEDAVVWNIPLSPRPPRERALSRTSTEPAFIAEPSADGCTPLRRPSSAAAVATAVPDMAAFDATPKKPRALPRSMSVNVPPDTNLRRPHTKSWNAAMSDLSAEARVLTAALEAFASERDNAHEDAVQAGTAPSLRLADTSTSTVDLPPLRRGDIMVDPLPISKAKEAVLTRTRPSWLPPKDQREERRHLKEYARMMASAREAERRKLEKSRREQVRRDRDRGSLSRIWEQHVLPNWDTCVREPRTRELWWRGVSARSRGDVWRRAVGNELGLTEASYQAALQRAKATEERLLGISEEQRETEKEWRWFEDIRSDVRTAFPELKIFQPDGGPLHDAFVELLMAYSMYRSDVGYVSGIRFVAALLLLNLSPSQSFITLANILNRPIPTAYLSRLSQSSNTQPIHTLILQTLHLKRPSLHTHLTCPSLSLPPTSYLDSILSTLFCSPKFGLDISSRIMDVYVFEGDKMLVRTAVATLARLEGKLYGNKDEIMQALDFEGRVRWELGGEEEFLGLCREMGKAGDGGSESPK